MTAPAWMPFYVGDYLKDTGNLGALEHGAYLLLILHYWQHGGLPSDEDELAAIARLTLPEWEKARKRLAKFFLQDWKHKRIDAELEKAQQTISKRKASGKAGANARYGKRDSGGTPNGTGGASQTHAPTPSKNSYSSETLGAQVPKSAEIQEERRVEVSPSDPVLQRPDDPLACYSETELKGLLFEFDGLDVESAICELTAWCDRKSITDLIERKNAIYGGLRKRHGKAKLYDSMQSPEAAPASQELLKTMKKKGWNKPAVDMPEFLDRRTRAA